MPYTYDWDGPQESDDDVNISLSRNITETYTLITSDPTIRGTGASLRFTTDTGIGIGSLHDEADNAYCSSIKSKFHKGSVLPKRKFDITVTYTSSPDSGGVGSAAVSGPAAPQVAGQQQGVAPQDRQPNPLLRGWDLTTSGGTRRVSIYYDRIGMALKNTVGDPMFPPLQRDAPTMKARLSVNRLVRFDEHYDYQGRVNNTKVTLPGMRQGFDPNGLKLMSVEITPVYDSGYSYFRHDYNIESGPYWNYDFTKYLGWAVQMPNVGKRSVQVVNNRTGIFPIYDESGTIVSEPKYLDANGRVLPDGFNNSQICWLTFYPDPSFDMKILWS